MFPVYHRAILNGGGIIMNTEERTNVTAVTEIREENTAEEPGKKKKKLSTGGIIGIIAGAVAAVAVIALALIFTFRVDGNHARAIALDAAGGGEVIQATYESEGLWNEYEFVIQSGDMWYNIEVGGFGQITGMESGRHGQLYVD